MKLTVTVKSWQFVAGMALAILPYTSLAAIFVVNSTGDLPDVSIADGICQTSAGDCTLRAAIMQANSTPEKDAIVFALNVTGTITLSGSELQILDAPLIIQGPGANRLTVDANFMSRVFFIHAPGFAVSISGLTLTHGVVVGASTIGGSSEGGCIYNEANLTLNGCTVSNSSTTGGNCFGGDCGGGRAWGGGIFSTADSSVSLLNCTVSGNSAIGGSGVSFHGSIVSGGHAYGGGFGGDTSEGNLIVQNCTFSGNSATGGQGSSGFFGSGGGGSAFGGGIYRIGSASMVACTISGNSAAGGAGGEGAPDGAGSGGGFNHELLANEPAAVRDSILAGNTVTTTGPDVAGEIASQGFNIIGQTDGSTGFNDPTDRSGTVAAPLDPGLDSQGLQDNGGLTPTIALLPSSIARNHGPDDAPLRDQRTYARNGQPDIGAFEFGGVAPLPHYLANISNRAFVGTGDNVVIGGLTITLGPRPKNVILRALGPTIGQPPFNVPGALADPVLEVHDSTGATISTNDDWASDANAQVVSDAGLAPPNNLEPALYLSLAPGQYTAILRGANNTTGLAVIEGYDVDPAAVSQFGNISARSFIQTGDGVAIAGVIIKGAGTQTVIIRGLGPTLGQPPFNVANALQDPFLDLRDGNGNRISANDNWKTDDEARIQATGLAPPNDAEAAILADLIPGDYTAILRGVNNTTGNALVEVYALN